MIETLISSRTRIKLLLKFFLNSNTTAYLRGLESEFGESSNAIRQELNKLEKAGMLSSCFRGNKKLFRANQEHPLFDEIHNILLKHIGLDKILENVVKGLGEIENVYLVGDFSKGVDSGIIDLVFIGDIDVVYLVKLIGKTEKLVKRKIRYLNYTAEEKANMDWGQFQPAPLLLWAK